ncbi:MAG: cytochrome c oxidase subunit II [Chloroflexi bacterium]|nr:cytochrome c oxidase subunit II [Chloroflexota bacterium]
MRWPAAAAAAALAVAIPESALAAPFWQTSATSSQAQSISFLFWVVMAIAAVLLVGVLGALLLIVVRFRDRPGAFDPRPVYGNLRLEMVWTGIPIVILIVVFGLMVGEMGKEIDIGPNALDITLVGHQWWWEFRYPDNVVTANELHVPVGRQVRLTLLSADVVHNFWVPSLNGKEQMIPGQTNIWTFTAGSAGTYDGACSEYCGTQHGWMRLTVVADQPAAFDQWLAAQRAPGPAASPAALQIYTANACGGCHTIAGVSNGKVAPDLSHIGSRQTIGAGVITNTPDNMRRWLQSPQDVKPGSYMPDFHFSGDQAQTLATYLESLK